jgi:DNA-binding Lrp family transcriptional regulator
MKLSPVQAKIIAAAQLNADNPLTKLRARTGCKEHTIRYTLERAREQGNNRAALLYQSVQTRLPSARSLLLPNI